MKSRRIAMVVLALAGCGLAGCSALDSSQAYCNQVSGIGSSDAIGGALFADQGVQDRLWAQAHGNQIEPAIASGATDSGQ